MRFMSLRAKAIRWLAGDATVIINCRIEGMLACRSPAIVADNNFVAPPVTVTPQPSEASDLLRRVLNRLVRARQAGPGFDGPIDADQAFDAALWKVQSAIEETLDGQP